MTTIGIIEDDRVLRENLEEFIHVDNSMSLLFSFNSIEKWLQYHKEENEESPSILFLDIKLPGISGLKAMSVIKSVYPDTKLVVISGESSSDTVLEAIVSGANGYLLKPFSLKEIKTQIDIITSGGAALSPDIAVKLLENVKNFSSKKEIQYNLLLTKRENEVFSQLIKGLTYKEISNILGVTSATVNDHIKKIYLKMQVNSKSELIAKVLANKQ